VTEDLDALATGGLEKAHVLNDPHNRHVHLLEHGNALAHDAHRRRLRCGDHNAAVQGHGLTQGKLSVSGARWQVHQQVIQLAPFHHRQELLDGFLDHGPAPDDGLVVVQQEADAHEFDAVPARRHHHFAGAEGGALPCGGMSCDGVAGLSAERTVDPHMVPGF